MAFMTLCFLLWVWFCRNKYLEIFDALLGPKKLPSAQLSVQRENTQLRPLCTLNHFLQCSCEQFCNAIYKLQRIWNEWWMENDWDAEWLHRKIFHNKEKGAKERCHIHALLPQNAGVIFKKANNSNVKCAGCFSLFLSEQEHPHPTPNY